MIWFQIPGLQFTSQPFIKKVKAGGKSICLIGYEGDIFALSAKCPHAGGDLSAGWCKNDELICPVHRYSYNLQTGKGAEGQNDYIDVFPVKVEDGHVYVGISSFWERLKEAFK